MSENKISSVAELRPSIRDFASLRKAIEDEIELYHKKYGSGQIEGLTIALEKIDSFEASKPFSHEKALMEELRQATEWVDGRIKELEGSKGMGMWNEMCRANTLADMKELKSILGGKSG